MHFGSLNCRGAQKPAKKSQIADDMHSYNIQMLALQETHIAENQVENITTSDGKQHYTKYYSGKQGQTRAGVGIVVRRDATASFLPVSERLCMCSVEMNKPKRKLTMICAYALTLPRSNANPALREDFYAELESLVNTVSKRNTLILAGDFNAKTG